jgi:hypothetical protein
MTAPSTLSKTEPVCVPSNRPRKKRILFASVHSVLDFSNGASVATLDILQGLASLGFECQAFCTAKLDIHDEVSFEKMIGDRRLRGVILGFWFFGLTVALTNSHLPTLPEACGLSSRK